MFKKIRLSIGNYLLKGKLKRSGERQRKVSNFENAVTIGVIYDATNRNTYQTILKFLRFLKEERKKVASIGFINSKDVTQFIEDQANDRFINRTDLNQWCCPKNDKISNFVNEEFDVLIDLNTEEHMPLKYICALSKARFKVSGAQPYQRQFCDLTIDVSQQLSVEFLIIQIKHYLNIVNKKNATYAV